MARSYAIVGTGAIGGFYGARLQRAGFDVNFLAHSDYKHIAGHGLSIESKDGNFNLPTVKVYGNARDMPRCDVAVVALKTTHNSLLPEMLPHVVNNRGIALLLQNGLGEEDHLLGIIGVNKIVSGLCFICSTKTGPGRIRHQDYGYVRFAEYTEDNHPAGITDIMREINGDFLAAGIESDMLPDLLLARWKKLVWNAPFSGLSVVLGADTAQIVNDPVSRERARKIMDEIVAGAAGFGRVIESEFVEKMIEDTKIMRPYFPSMKLDYDAGRRMELESMYANPIKAAEKKGVKMPCVAQLYQELKEMERRREGMV